MLRRGFFLFPLNLGWSVIFLNLKRGECYYPKNYFDILDLRFTVKEFFFFLAKKKKNPDIILTSKILVNNNALSKV